MDAFILIALGIVNGLCFVIGAKIGRAVVRGEGIKLPSVNPVEAYRKHEAKKAAEAEQNKIDTIMANIEAYDGTPFGQKDVPGG